MRGFRNSGHLIFEIVNTSEQGFSNWRVSFEETERSSATSSSVVATSYACGRQIANMNKSLVGKKRFLHTTPHHCRDYTVRYAGRYRTSVPPLYTRLYTYSYVLKLYPIILIRITYTL